MKATSKTESRQDTKTAHFVKTDFRQLVGEGVDPRLSWLSGYIKREPEPKDIRQFLGVSEQAAKKLRQQLKKAEWQGQSGYYLSSPAAVYLKPVAFRMLDRIYRQVSRCVKTGYRATLTAAKLAQFAGIKRFKPILEELQRAGFIAIIRAERGKYTLSRGENLAATSSPLLKQKPQKRAKKAIEPQNKPIAAELPLIPQSEQIEPLAALESQPEELEELIALDRETPIENCYYLEEQEQEPSSIGRPCSWELAQLEDQEIEAAEEPEQRQIDWDVIPVKYESFINTQKEFYKFQLRINEKIIIPESPKGRKIYNDAMGLLVQEQPDIKPELVTIKMADLVEQTTEPKPEQQPQLDKLATIATTATGQTGGFTTFGAILTGALPTYRTREDEQREAAAATAQRIREQERLKEREAAPLATNEQAAPLFELVKNF